MAKNINLGSISLPITQYASQGNAVLGIRDSGKSYSATYLAEQLFAAGIPFVTFDPSGVWKFLRVAGKGKGLPIVVAGGKVPDLPLTPASAPEIVRAAMRANVSLVIDLYDLHLSKADWTRIVESCVRVLLYENGDYGLRHIFIEEAAEFCPQIVSNEKAKVYAEVEKLARIGGNALLGYTLINQRAEQVNKAVLELCDCLFLHRQKGKNSIQSLEKWLSYSGGVDVREIVRGLPTLASGQSWIWPANADVPVLVKMPQKETFHPDRRALIANPEMAKVQRTDASKFVTELKGSLAKYLEEAKANDPEELKKRIRELEKKLETKTASREEIDEARRDGVTKGYAAASAAIAGKVSAVVRAGDEFMERIRSIGDSMESGQTIEATGIVTPRAAERFSAKIFKVERDSRQKQVNIVSGDISKGEATILNALIQFPEGLRREQITVLTTFARSTRDKYLQYLQGKGFVESTGDKVFATDAGRRALPDSRPLPRGKALREHWFAILPEGEAQILRVLCEEYPKSISREDLSDRTGFARSTRDKYLQYMQNKMIVEATRGEVCASATLF